MTNKAMILTDLNHGIAVANNNYFVTVLASFVAECLSEHNKVRAKHGAPALKWDATLAANAQKWADNLKVRGMSLPSVHDPSATNQGENIAMLSNPNCKDAVEMW